MEPKANTVGLWRTWGDKDFSYMRVTTYAQYCMHYDAIPQSSPHAPMVDFTPCDAPEWVARALAQGRTIRALCNANRDVIRFEDASKLKK
jgi:hypothetical protein